MIKITCPLCRKDSNQIFRPLSVKIECCSLCLDNSDEHLASLINCGHTFHDNCLKNYCNFHNIIYPNPINIDNELSQIEYNDYDSTHFEAESLYNSDIDTDINSSNISIITNDSYNNETSLPIEILPLLPHLHTEFEFINNVICYWKYLPRFPQYLGVLCYAQTSVIFTEIPYNLLNRTFVAIEPRVPFRCRAESFYDDMLHTNIWVLIDNIYM
jgi:hypothetical protein